MGWSGSFSRRLFSGLCRGDLVLCGSQAGKQLHRPAIAATGFRSSSTAPRIVAITTTTAPATHTARTSFSIAFPSQPSPPSSLKLALERPPRRRAPERRPVDEIRHNNGGDRKTLAFSMSHRSLAGVTSLQPSAHVMKHLPLIFFERYRP